MSHVGIENGDELNENGENDEFGYFGQGMGRELSNRPIHAPSVVLPILEHVSPFVQ